MRKFIMICFVIMSLAILSGCATTKTTATVDPTLTNIVTTKAMARNNCHMPSLTFKFDHLLTPRAAEENRYRAENLFFKMDNFCMPVNVFHVAAAELIGASPVEMKLIHLE